MMEFFLSCVSGWDPASHLLQPLVVSNVLYVKWIKHLKKICREQALHFHPRLSPGKVLSFVQIAGLKRRQWRENGQSNIRFLPKKAGLFLVSSWGVIVCNCVKGGRDGGEGTETGIGMLTHCMVEWLAK